MRSNQLKTDKSIVAVDLAIVEKNTQTWVIYQNKGVKTIYMGVFAGVDDGCVCLVPRGQNGGTVTRLPIVNILVVLAKITKPSMLVSVLRAELAKLRAAPARLIEHRPR